MPSYSKDNLLIKLKSKKVPQNGINFTDLEGNPTPLMLYRTEDNDGVFLDLTQQKIDEPRKVTEQRKLFRNDAKSIRNALTLARQIALDLDKSVFTSYLLSTKADIVNFIRFNDKMTAMTSDEVNTLEASTGNTPICDLDMILSLDKDPYSLKYSDRKACTHNFRYIHIPRNTPVKFVNNENVSDKFKLKITTQEDNHDYSNIDVTSLKKTKIISIQNNHCANIIPPKMNKNSILEIINTDTTSNLKREMFENLINNNVNFRYYMESYFRDNLTYLNTEDFMSRGVIRKYEYRDFIHNAARKYMKFVDIFNLFESHNMNMNDFIPDLKKHHDYIFIINNKKEFIEQLYQRLPNIVKSELTDYDKGIELS